jgi:hypothetical protein
MVEMYITEVKLKCEGHEKGEKMFEPAYPWIWRANLSVEADLCMIKWMEMKMWQLVNPQTEIWLSIVTKKWKKKG